MIKLNKDKFSTKYEFCDSSLHPSLLNKFDISGTQIKPSYYLFILNNYCYFAFAKIQAILSLCLIH